MVVEFTASTCTFCGGEVGTAPGQRRETAGHAAGGAGQGRGEETLSCCSGFPGDRSAENGEGDGRFGKLIVTLQRSRTERLLIFCWGIF